MSQVAVAERVLVAGVPSLPARIRKVRQDAYETYTYWVAIDDPQARRAKTTSSPAWSSRSMSRPSRPRPR